MTISPTITTVIPTYNRRYTLGRALDSVIQQTVAVTEIIVVDDGSTDDSVAFLRKHYPQVKIIQQLNQGVSHARNNGIKAAKSQWVALLDSDDQWQQNKIEQQLHCLSKNPGMLLCHSNEKWIRNGEHFNQMKKHNKTGGHIFKQCLPLCAISPSSTLIRRDVFETCGYFDESLPACEDYDMWLRICARYPVHYIDEALIIKHGGHDDQLSKKYWGMDRFRVQALKKIIDENILNDDNRKAAIDMLLKKCKILINGAKKRDKHESVNHYEQVIVKFEYQPGSSLE